jgi:hypothetical protein
MIDKLMDWYTLEDDSLLALLKIIVINFILVIIVLTFPIWLLPYLIYKKSKRHNNLAK